MRERCFRFWRFVLPALFMVYLAGIISFTHVHIINGVTIVHSHPFQDNADGAEHQHTGTELQLLHNLSTIQQAGSCLFDYTIAPLYVFKTIRTDHPAFHSPIGQLNRTVQLRAPPVLV